MFQMAYWKKARNLWRLPAKRTDCRVLHNHNEGVSPIRHTPNLGDEPADDVTRGPEPRREAPAALHRDRIPLDAGKQSVSQQAAAQVCPAVPITFEMHLFLSADASTCTNSDRLDCASANARPAPRRHRGISKPTSSNRERTASLLNLGVHSVYQRETVDRG